MKRLQWLLALFTLTLPVQAISDELVDAGPVVIAPLAVGGGHACAVTEKQKVICWGRNSEGQLGDGSRSAESGPVEVFALSHVKAVTSGQAHTCALQGDGKVKCWGRASGGQLGGGDMFRAASYLVVPIQVEALEDVAALSAGANHSCALTTSGDVFCWGNNSHGQLGDGSTDARFTAVRASIRDVRQIAAGSAHTCALTQAGEVHCWGMNRQGQLGIGDRESKPRPVRIETLPRAVSIASGDNHACAVDEIGRTFCWGANAEGQLGCGYMVEFQTRPVAVIGLSSAESLSLGSSHSCALLKSGEVSCWGDNDSGQLGNGRKADFLIPAQAQVRAQWWIAAGGDRTCGLSGRGRVSCWGAGQSAPSALRLRERIHSEGRITGLSLANAPVQGGREFTCALLDSGKVACWGKNDSGQLGRGSTSGRESPAEVPGIENAVALAAGGDHACAILGDSTVKCWGHGTNGELGNGATVHSFSPVPVTGLNDAEQISSGEYFTCILLRNGRVTCWGSNVYGQLGDGSTTARSTPAPVTGLPSNAVTIAAGYEHACAIVQEGAVYCWGRGRGGRLGNGSTGNLSAPVAVSGLQGATAISAGYSHTCVLKDNGTVWCWGDNDYGAVGNGSTSSSTVPHHVSELSEVIQIAASNHSTCALKSDGTLWCWGHNGFGDVGIGNTNHQHRPVQVSGVGEIAALGKGGWNSWAVLQDGTLKGWGYNNASQIGLGPANTTDQLTPVTIPLPERVQMGAARRPRPGGSTGTASGSTSDAEPSGRTEPESPDRPESGRDDGERYDDRF